MGAMTVTICTSVAAEGGTPFSTAVKGFLKRASVRPLYDGDGRTYMGGAHASI